MPCSAPSTAVTQDRHGGRKWLRASRRGWGGCHQRTPPIQARHTPPKGKKGVLDSRHAGIIENLRDGLKGGENGSETKAYQVCPVW